MLFDKKDNEVDLKVFKTEEEALLFIQEFNN